MSNTIKNTIIALVLLMTGSAQALTPEFKTYLRAGTGANGKGGAQECVFNKGAGGNEFRLGNECGIYGEFSLGADVLKAENAEKPFWRLYSNFAFVYDNRTDWEGNNPNSWVLRELYSEGGRIDGMNFSLWVGKRFYRWGDVHMDDFYAVDMSGPGGGIGDIKTDIGTWSVAFIQNASSNELNGTGTAVVTTVGNAAKTSLHIRLDEMQTPIGTFSYWLAGGTTPSTKNVAGTTDYKSTSGGYLAMKYFLAALGGGNELGVATGQGAMSNLSSQGDIVKDCADATKAECTVASSKKVRVWDSFHFEGENWSGQIAAVYEESDKGTTTDSRVRWASFGVRPIYWFTDHVGLAFQAGVSNVLDESDGLGSRNLMRYTIAPQMSIGKGFYSRPVLRAFYSRTSWNENNKISAKGTSFANSTDMDSFGLQTEVWF
jgi:maltoporin